jgi:hypothetical protein
MIFEGRIREINLSDEPNKRGLILTIDAPFYEAKKDIPLEKRKEAQEQIESYNLNLIRLHTGYIKLDQIIDSSEIQPKEEKEE